MLITPYALNYYCLLTNLEEFRMFHEVPAEGKWKKELFDKDII